MSSPSRSIAPFLLLLFTGTLCSSMIVPFMGYFLVEELGQPRWIISLYTALIVPLTIVTNKIFAKRLDQGSSAFPLVGVAISGCLFASVSLSLSPTFLVTMTCGVMGYGIASSAISTMFSTGIQLADTLTIDRSRLNAYMRATTSTAWMTGPALTFITADQLGAEFVFQLCGGFALLWTLLWYAIFPRGSLRSPSKAAAGVEASSTPALWLAAAYIFCLSTAHSITFTALPLFWVQEIGLPGYAPGTAFSVKTAVEIVAIFSTPFLIRQFGLRLSLIGTTVFACVTIVVMSQITNIYQMWAAAAMEGIYYGLYASLGLSFIQSFTPNAPARATALYWNTVMVSGLAAGPVVGLIAQHYSFQAAIQTAASLAVVALALIMIGSLRSQHETAPDQG
ncbi:MAG: MFS transporter [Pelagimonas sp.]